MIEDGRGGFKVKFVLKEHVPSTIGIPYAATIDETDSLFSLEPESAHNLFTRHNSMWRDRNRGISLQNKKDCDEIVRQFLAIDFDETMMLHSSENEPLVTSGYTSINFDAS